MKSSVCLLLAVALPSFSHFPGIYNCLLDVRSSLCICVCVFLYLCVRLCGAAWKGLIKRSSFVDAARSRPSSSISTRLALRAFHFSESLKFEYDIISLMSFTITIMIIQHATPSIDVSTTQISSRATSNFRCCSCCCWFYCGSISALFFFFSIMTAISLQFLRYFPHHSRLQFICTEIKIILAELANF